MEWAAEPLWCGELLKVSAGSDRIGRVTRSPAAGVRIEIVVFEFPSSVNRTVHQILLGTKREVVIKVEVPALLRQGLHGFLNADMPVLADFAFFTGDSYPVEFPSFLPELVELVGGHWRFGRTLRTTASRKPLMSGTG